MSVSNDHLSNRKDVIAMLKPRYVSIDAETRADAELIAKCALAQFTEPEDIQKLSGPATQVTTEPAHTSFEDFNSSFTSVDYIQRDCTDDWCGSKCALDCVRTGDIYCMYQCFLRFPPQLSFEAFNTSVERGEFGSHCNGTWCSRKCADTCVAKGDIHCMYLCFKEYTESMQWSWEDTEGSMSPENSTRKIVDGNKGSGWVLVLQISNNISGPFQYDSELWANDVTLNSEYTRVMFGKDVKLRSYSTQPLSAVRVCVDSLDRCYTIEEQADSARELFSGSYRRRDDIHQKDFESIFEADQLRASFESNSTQCMQRPGFNTKCNGGNKARFGFCGNLPEQPCQPNDNDDADFAIGIGLSGQANGRMTGSESMSTQMGAGYTDYFADNAPGAPGSSSKSFQAWVFVLAPGSDIQNEIFPPPDPSYIHVNRATCANSHWIQLDLGRDFLVGRVHRWLYFSDRAYCNQKIELSQTGNFDGEEHIAFSCDTFAQCGNESTNGRLIEFESVQARFVRYYISRNNLDAGVGHISEIEIFGWSIGTDRNHSKFSQATWGNDSMLVLNVSKTITPGELVEVVIPSAFGLTIPVDGIRHNASNFGLASDAVLGPVSRYPLTPLAMTTGVGSFSGSQRLDVTPRRAGAAAAFTLSFSPKMKLYPDDTVSFFLRNVTGSSGDFCVGPAMGSQSTFHHGSWILERSELVLTVNQAAEADENISVVIPSSVGLLLPSAGIGMNTDSFTVSANTRDGYIPVLPRTYLFNRPAIGVLSEMQISFDDTCVGESISGFDLSFQIGMDILVGEQIFLTIPGFVEQSIFTCTQHFNTPNGTGECSAATCSGGLCPGTNVAVTGNSSHFTEAEWIHPNDLDEMGMYVSNQSVTSTNIMPFTSSVLMLTAKSGAPGGSKFFLRVHMSPASVLPDRLVDIDITGITLQCNARHGPVLPSRVNTVLGLGKFETIPTLETSSRSPASLTTLNVSFELREALQPLSTIEFSLPGFKHFTDGCGDGCTPGMMPMNNSASSMLSIEGPDALLFGYTPLLPCNVTMPTVFAGCDWSPSAVEMNTPGLCYSVRCPPGCVLNDNVTTSVYGQCRGANDVFLEGRRYIETGYEPFSSSICRAGIYAGVISTDGGTFTFTRVNPAHTTSVQADSDACAGFRNGVRSGKLSGPLIRVESAFQVYPRPLHLPIDWNEDLQILSIPVGRSELAAGRKFAVNIPGFVVPRSGISSNSAMASIIQPPFGEPQLESLGGGFLPLPPSLSARNALLSEAVENEGLCKREGRRFLDTQPLGSTGNTASLEFSPRFSGAATNVKIEFTPEMDIVANDYFLVRLPNFISKPFSDTPWLSGKSAHQLSASWSSVDYILNCTVRCGTLLPAKEHVSVTILSRALLRLPLAGISDSDSSEYTIEFHTNSPVPPQSFPASMILGSFTNSPRLRFSATAKADAATEIFVSYIPEMIIEVGEDVTFTLPDFQGPAGLIDCSSVPAGIHQSASWDPVSFSLRMIALGRIDAKNYVSVSIAAHIAVPSDGVGLDQPDFLIASNAAAGPVQGQPVPSVAPVGAFLESDLAFDPPVAGEIVSITFLMIPAMTILANETIELVLPDFGGESVDSFRAISTPQGIIGECSWHSPSHTLTLTVEHGSCTDNAVYLGELTKIIIPSSIGISLPEIGVRLNNSITVSSSAVFGRVMPTAVKHVQPVGSFLVKNRYGRGAPSIEFTNEQTEPISFTVSFRPQMHLLPGEEITLSLPEFRSTLSQNLSVDFTAYPAGSVSSAVFNSTSQTLGFIIGQAVPPNESLKINVLRSSQIYVRYDGVRWDQSGFALSSKAADGPVLPIDISKTNAVGTIFGTGIGNDAPFLEYEPRVAGEPAALFFHFICSMVVDVNETFTIHLPEFSEASESYAGVPMILERPFRSAVWYRNTSRLELTTSDRIEPRTPLFVTIESSAGMRLPSQGMRTSHRLTIEIDAQAGQRQPIRVNAAMLGTFAPGLLLRYRTVVHDYLGVEVGKRNEPTELDLTFSPTMNILPRELITVNLDKFLGTQNENIVVVSDPVGSIGNASWIETEYKLVLTALQGVSAHTRVNVIVPSTSQIRLPIDGVKANQTTLWISVDAADGPVWAPGFYAPASGGSGEFTRSTVITRSEAVGAFINPRISWLPPSSGAYAGILLQFVPRMSLNAGDTITLVLPGLGGFDSTVEGFVAQNFQRTLMAGSWSTDTHMLTLSVSSVVGADTDVAIVVPSTSGIRIPDIGIILNDPRYLIFCDAIDGVIPPTKLSGVEPVGTILHSSLDFEPRKANTPTIITFQLELEVALQHGDTLSLSLESFHLPLEDRQAFTVISDPAGMFEVVWAVADKRTMINLRHTNGTITNRQRFTLVFPSSCGIHTPVNGTIENSGLNTIAVQSLSGSNAHTSIFYSPAIGAFTWTSLDFSPQKANEASSITIQIVASMILVEGDEIVVRLPDFQGPSCSVALDSSPSVVRSGSWNLTTGEVAFHLAKRVNASQLIVITFPNTATCAIKIPAGGISALREEQRHFVISSNAKNGPVLKSPPELATQIMHVQHVFALAGTSQLSFLPNVAGVSSTLKFEFEPAMNLSRGAEVALLLSSFSSKPFSISNLMSIPAGLFSQANWDSPQRTRQLVLKVAIDIQRFTKITVWIPKTSGLTLPTQGIGSKENIFVSIFDFAGSMLPTRVQSVGRSPRSAKSAPRLNGFEALFLQPPSLTFGKALAGAASTMTLEGHLRGKDFSHLKDIMIHIELPGFTGPESLIFTMQDSEMDESDNTVQGNWSNTKSCVPVCHDTTFAIGNPLESSALTFNLRNGTCPLFVGLNGVSCESKCTTSTWLELTFEDFSKVTSGQVMAIQIPTSTGIRLPQEGIEAGRSEYMASFTSAGKAKVRELHVSVILNIQPVGFLTAPPALEYHPKRSSSVITLMFSFTLAFKLTEFESISLELPGFTGGPFRDLEVSVNSTSLAKFKAHWTTEGGSANILMFTLSEGHHVSACQEVTLTLSSAAGLRLPKNALKANDSRLRMHTHGRFGVLDSHAIVSPAIGSFDSGMSLLPSHRSPAARAILNITFVPQMQLAVGDVVSIHLPGFNGDSSDCFPIVSEPLGVAVLANWSAIDSLLMIRAEREIAPFQTVQVQVASQSGIFLPTSGLRAHQSNITISTNAAAGVIERQPVEVVPEIGWFLESDISFFPRQSDTAVEMTLRFATSHLLSVNDTISLFLPGFREEYIMINTTTNASGDFINSWASFHEPSPARDPSRQSRLPFVVSSSGVYAHPVDKNGATASRSSLPLQYECVPCVASVLFDGDDLADGYYKTVCGLGGSDLWQGLHSLLLSTHQGIEGGSSLRRAIEEVDGISSTDQEEELILKLMYTGEHVVKNSSSQAYESKWSPAFAWPQALGVGYQQAACESLQCASGHALTDLHHQFPADSKMAELRAKPLHYTTGTNEDIFKTSMLFSDCDDSCLSDPHAPEVRYSADWMPFVDVFEPAEDTRGDFARALFYMAVRYDGDDGLTDLELKDFQAGENPECCFQTDFLQGCVNPVCYMGQLSTLLRWHVEDPPTSSERERNTRVQHAQGNRNPFVDFPQLSSLLWGNETSGHKKLGTPGSLETLSDCGRDNSSIVHGEWVKDEGKLELTVNRRIDKGQSVQVTIPSSLGIRLPMQGIFARNNSADSIPSISDFVQGAIHLSIDSRDAPLMKTPILKSDSAGVFKFQPKLEFGPAAFAGEVTSLNVSVTSAVDLFDGDSLALHLPRFSVRQNTKLHTRAVSLVIGYELNCSERCNVTCSMDANATNASEPQLSQPTSDDRYFDSPGVTCSSLCSDHCVQADIISQNFSGQIISDFFGISIIITMNLRKNDEGAFAAGFWPKDKAVSFLITEEAGINLPISGVPSKGHNITLNLTMTNCSHHPDGNERMCSNSTGPGEFPLVSSVHVKPGVGSVDDVSLDYLPLIPGKSVDIMLDLATRFDLTVGDYIVLQLPAFGIEAGHESSYETSAVIFNTSMSQIYAIWSKRCPKDSLILMFLRPNLLSQGDILMDSVLNILVPFRLGVMLPYAHLPKDLNVLTIAAHAEDGTLLHRLGSVGSSPAIITMNWRTTEITFTPSTAGKETSIWFSFTASDPLKPGDEIIVKLPGFTGPEKDCFPTIEMYPSDAITSAAWNATEESLLYRVSNYVDAGVRVWVLMDISAQISLPVNGVIDNGKLLPPSPLMPHERQITVSATTGVGSIRLAPLSLVAPVGQINRSLSSVTFEPMRAGEVSEITVSIVAFMDFDVGDTISLHLPGFNASHFQHSADRLRFCILTHGVACNATFDSKSAILKMTVCRFAPAGLPAVSVIPMAAGIVLPSTLGSSQNDDRATEIDANLDGHIVQDIFISTDAKDGVISDSPRVTLARLPAIGKFNTSSLSLGTVEECTASHVENASQTTLLSPDLTTGRWKCIKSLSLTFTLDMNLREGDEIVLKLPGFTAVGGGGTCHVPSLPVQGRITPSTNSSEPIESHASFDALPDNLAYCFSLNAMANGTISDARFINEDNTIRVQVLAPIRRWTQIGFNLSAGISNSSGLVPPSEHGRLIWQSPRSFTISVRGRNSQIAPTPVSNADVNSAGFFDSPAAEITTSNNWELFGLKLQFLPARQLKLGDLITWKFPGIRSRRWGRRGVIDDSTRYSKRNISISKGFECQNVSLSPVNCSNSSVGVDCSDNDTAIRHDHWHNTFTFNESVNATETFRYNLSARTRR